MYVRHLSGNVAAICVVTNLVVSRIYRVIILSEDRY